MAQRSNGDDPRLGTDEALSHEARGFDPDEEPVTLDFSVQEQLGKVFRAYCDDLIRQPVPDRFLVLLAKLDAKLRENK